MHKIEKYLKEINWSILYLGKRVERHPNGRSFHSDGTYTVEIYTIYKDSMKFQLRIKVSGRKDYTLWDGGKLEILTLSQGDFIREFKRYLDNINKEG
ncbi:hypothetical protein D3C81_07680 [compost metagenome]